jgi:hypothetical protein
MTQIRVNVSARDIIRARQSAIGMPLDGKRAGAWDVYGWPQVVEFEQLRTAYERTGAGHRAVHHILDRCWESLPRIKTEGSEADATPWETATAAVFKACGAWRKLRDLDRRNMVGRFAALIYRVADGQPLSEPLVSARKLVDLVPVYEDQLRVTRWHDDPADADNYGKPAMCEFRTMPPGSYDTQAQPETWVSVHASRVQFLAEGSVGSIFDGVPLLRAGFNALVDLEKVQGGSAESFLKNSARTITLEFDPQSDPQALTRNADGTPSGKTVGEAIEDKIRAMNENTDASIVLQGGKATALQTTTSDPRGAFETAAQMFAASVGVPYTILFGQQTGRLASAEDKLADIARCTSRRVNDLTPMIEELVRRLQACSILQAGDFEVEWPDLAAPSDSDKLDLADKMAAVNQKAHAAGSLVFEPNEIRRAAGYEEADDLMTEGADPQDVAPEQDPEDDAPRLARVA